MRTALLACLLGVSLGCQVYDLVVQPTASTYWIRKTPGGEIVVQPNLFSSLSGAAYVSEVECLGPPASGYLNIRRGALYYESVYTTASSPWIVSCDYSACSCSCGDKTCCWRVKSCVPCAPGAPTFSSVTSTQIKVSWTAPAGSPSNYQVFIGSSGYQQSGRTKTFTGLSPGTSYSFKVRAQNGIGWGGYSSTRSQTTNAVVSSAPRNLRLSVRTSTSITMAWDAPSSTGGASIIDYQTQRKTTGSFGNSVTSTGRSVAINSLAMGTTYTFRTRARNSVGYSAWSSEVAVATLAELPGAPSCGCTTSSTSSTITVAWGTASANGATITEYQVYARAEGGSWSGTETNSATRSFTLTEMLPGTSYEIRLKSKNSEGWSSAYSSITTIATTPTPPTIVRTLATADVRANQVTLAWNVPSSDGGRAITHYTVLTDGSAPRTVPGGTTTITITSLTEEVEYSFSVNAENSEGPGPSAVLAVTTITASCGDTVENGDETDVDCGGSVCPSCDPGDNCLIDADCASNICTDGNCSIPTCVDNVVNAEETDVDCGGSTCDACPTNATCALASDCISLNCDGGVCREATCTDGILNALETDVDCGGTTCPGCVVDDSCVVASDCAESVCVVNICQAPTCLDGARNQLESDVDCGGPCAPCAHGETCFLPNDCVSRVCTSGVCVPPACSDDVQNGEETDDDCGGGACSPCDGGQTCVENADCSSILCDEGVCANSLCDDAVQNGGESDVDCGGSTACRRCFSGDSCLEGSDCESEVCFEGTCQAPTCEDGVRNSVEVDVDCGPGCSPCTTGQNCLNDVHCSSNVCANNTCQAPTCADDTRNQGESDVGCGGPCPPCVTGRRCVSDFDCLSLKCVSYGDNATRCAPPSCDDLIKNGDEEDVDCGGACGACVNAVIVAESPAALTSTPAFYVPLLIVLCCLLTLAVFALAFVSKKKGRRSKRAYMTNDDSTVVIENDDIGAQLQELIDDSSPIAQGGFGDVYKITLKGDEVALKVLTVHTVAAEQEFHQEVHVMTRLLALGSTKTIGLKVFCEDPMCIGLEFAAEGSLFSIIKEREPEWEFTLEAAVGCATALAYIHDLDLFHADIKTHNFLKTSNGIVLSDFGTSYFLDGEMPGEIKGTPKFLAPERYNLAQGKGDPNADPLPSDVFSLGITLWTLTTHTLPFDTVENTMVAGMIAKSDSFRPPFKKSNIAPPWFKELCAMCWVQDPDERPTADVVERKLKSESDPAATSLISVELERDSFAGGSARW